MQLFIQDLVNKLPQLSEKLDNYALFIDKPWVLIDSNLVYQKYIFKKNGELIISIDGNVQVGNWEYLTTAKSLIIDRITDKILLNQSFINKAIMILKIDGSKNQFVILANEILIPDLDIKKYLRSLDNEQNINTNKQQQQIISEKLDNGKTIEFYCENNIYRTQIGMKVTFDGEDPDDGEYISRDTFFHYEIKDKKVSKIFRPFKYQTNDGINLIIKQLYYDSISIGDLVYIENKLAHTGKYKIGVLNVIHVFNGVVSKKSLF